MRVAILTHPTFRSPRFLADGLRRMLLRIGVAADCHYLALPDLLAMAQAHASRRNRVAASVAGWRHWLRRLETYDLLVVSDTVGIIGRSSFLAPLRRLNRPILHYEVFAYAGSQHFVRQFGPRAQYFFDGFLAVSGIHDDPPIDGPAIFEIGMDLPTLAKLQPDRAFSALLDFPRPGYEAQRQIQIDALKALNIPYSTLHGEYSFFDIDRIYAQSAVAFVAFPEAFGIPIVQLQRHGSSIASPFPHWVKRHALRPAGHVFNETSDTDCFSDNFVFYRSVEDLKLKLDDLRSNFNPRRISGQLDLRQGGFVRGRPDVLQAALDEVMSSFSSARACVIR